MHFFVRLWSDKILVPHDNHATNRFHAISQILLFFIDQINKQKNKEENSFIKNNFEKSNWKIILNRKFQCFYDNGIRQSEVIFRVFWIWKQQLTKKISGILTRYIFGSRKHLKNQSVTCQIIERFSIIWAMSCGLSLTSWKTLAIVDCTAAKEFSWYFFTSSLI